MVPTTACASQQLDGSSTLNRPGPGHGALGEQDAHTVTMTVAEQRRPKPWVTWRAKSRMMPE